MTGDSISRTFEHIAARLPSRGEIAADGIIHALAILAGLIGGGALIVLSAMNGSAVVIVAVAIYSAGLLLMFSCSCLYNMARRHRRRDLFRRLDHAGIFVMIAGTYTPFTLIMLPGTLGITLLVVVWALAVAGIVIKLFWPLKLERVSTLLYVGLGWLGIVALEPLLASEAFAALILLGVGGALYTIGVGFHHWERLPYQNAIWHGFVVAAAGSHYGAVFNLVL